MRLIKNLILFFLVFFLSFSLIRTVVDFQKKKQFLQRFQTEVDKEEKKKLELEAEILKKTDQYQLEKTIRNKLNLSQPDEVVIILSPPTPTPTKAISPPLSNWKKWWRVFFH